MRYMQGLYKYTIRSLENPRAMENFHGTFVSKL